MWSQTKQREAIDCGGLVGIGCSTLGSEWLELLPRSKGFCTLPEDSAPLLKCRGREVPLIIALVAACMPTPLLPTKSRGEQIFCFGKL